MHPKPVTDLDVTKNVSPTEHEKMREDLERLGKDVAARDVEIASLRNEIQQLLPAVTKSINKMGDKLDFKVVADSVNAQTRAIKEGVPINMNNQLDPVVQQLTAMNNNLQTVHTEIAKIGATVADDSGERKDRTINRVMVAGQILIALGTLGTLAVAADQLKLLAATGNAAPTPDTTTGDKELDAELLKLWTAMNNITDDVFWDQIIAFVTMPRSWTLYLIDQITIMAYVRSWFPYYGEWNWATAQDKIDMVNGFATAYGTGSDNGKAMYTLVKSTTYPGDPTKVGKDGENIAVPLPRAIGAELVQLALAQVIAAANPPATS
jgi:hypothetical protein